MFGKKSPDNSKESVALSQIQTQVIPPEFYAGANPVVKFKEIKKEFVVNESGQVLSAAEQAMLKKAKTAGGDNKMHPANLFTNRKFLIIGGVILFVLFLVGGGIYYWLVNRPQSQPTATPPAVTYTPTSVPTEVTPEPVSLPVEMATTTPSSSLSQEPELVFPAIITGDSEDLDNDGITDIAEAIFKTDPSVPDTDGDKYLDGSEVYHLYDPAKKTPAKLIDSGLVKEFDNPVFGYKVYYPSTWEVGNVDQKYRQVLFSAINGEYVEIRIFDMDPGATFADWFAKWARSERYSDLLSFDTMFGGMGWRRPDNLVNYFMDGTQYVYVMTYHSLDNVAPINFRIVSQMIARSFRLTGNYNPLPVQPPADQFVPTSTVDVVVEPITNTNTLEQSNSTSSVL